MVWDCVIKHRVALCYIRDKVCVNVCMALYALSCTPHRIVRESGRGERKKNTLHSTIMAFFMDLELWVTQVLFYIFLP